MQDFSSYYTLWNSYTEQLWSRFTQFPLPLLWGEVFLLVLILWLIFAYRRFAAEKSFFGGLSRKFIAIFELVFEKVFDFFNDIIGQGQKYWVKSFVIGIFFVILFSNIAGVFFDFMAMMFPGLENYIIAPTTDANFNIAMAIVSTLLVLYLQMRKLGVWKFLYEYLPIFGKNIITFERGKMPAILYYPLLVFVKAFDILISLFVWALDIIGQFAKVISLSFRLTGNMMSGTILLGMLVVAIKGLTSTLLNGIEFPVLFPLLIVIQGLLVAVIQAFVFALLTAIFIKVATEE